MVRHVRRCACLAEGLFVWPESVTLRGAPFIHTYIHTYRHGHLAVDTLVNDVAVSSRDGSVDLCVLDKEPKLKPQVGEIEGGIEGEIEGGRRVGTVPGSYPYLRDCHPQRHCSHCQNHRKSLTLPGLRWDFDHHNHLDSRCSHLDRSRRLDFR